MIDDKGREVPDPTPVEVPMKIKNPRDPLHTELVRQLVKHEISRLAEVNGWETIEESDDFEVEDEENWVSPYELTDMQDETPLPSKEEPEQNAPDETPEPPTGTKDEDVKDEPEKAAKQTS